MPVLGSVRICTWGPILLKSLGSSTAALWGTGEVCAEHPHLSLLRKMRDQGPSLTMKPFFHSSEVMKVPSISVIFEFFKRTP